MATLPRPFRLDGHLIVIGDEFYEAKPTRSQFPSCFVCDIRQEHVATFCGNCPLKGVNYHLVLFRPITGELRARMEQARMDNPDSTWFLLERNEGIPPQNEQHHNSDNMETVSKTTFREIAGRIADLQEKKNESYGNAFGQSCDKYGVVSALTRLNDKLNRLDSLYKSSEKAVFGESFSDTLTDLAAYAIMTIEWLESQSDDDLQ